MKELIYQWAHYPFNMSFIVLINRTNESSACFIAIKCLNEIEMRHAH